MHSRPPYRLTPKTLDLLLRLHEQIGAVQALETSALNPGVRRHNRIRTVHATLHLEGNSLELNQAEALTREEVVFASNRDVLEWHNAWSVYQKLGSWDGTSVDSFLEAHRQLTNGLVDRPGKWRNRAVGIARGNTVVHVAPPEERVPYLMLELFDYLRYDPDPALIKACVFQYELEFVHPFTDGNGRMGRLWQTVLLAEAFPVLAHVPVEAHVAADPEAYYWVLAQCDRQGSSAPFVEYQLGVLLQGLNELHRSQLRARRSTPEERLLIYWQTETPEFTRKDYRRCFPQLSTASASRDLQMGIEQGFWTRSGEKNQSTYVRQSRTDYRGAQSQ